MRRVTFIDNIWDYAVLANLIRAMMKLDILFTQIMYHHDFRGEFDYATATHYERKTGRTIE